jgi:hypothetical protein
MASPSASLSQWTLIPACLALRDSERTLPLIDSLCDICLRRSEHYEIGESTQHSTK